MQPIGHFFIFSHTLPHLCHLSRSHVIPSLFPPHLPPPIFSLLSLHHLSGFLLFLICFCCCTLSSFSVFHLPFPLSGTSLYCSKTKDREGKIMMMCVSISISFLFIQIFSKEIIWDHFQKWDICLFSSAYPQNEMMNSSKKGAN